MERVTLRHRSVINKAIAAASELLLPACCAVCTRLLSASENGIVCGHCWSRVREISHPRCSRCGHAIDAHSCRWCDNLPPFVRAARSFCWIGPGTGKQIVHSLKYDGWMRAGAEIAERMSRARFPEDVIRERSALVPVPLSKGRQRERGFNQSEVIADRLAELWKIPLWANVLERAQSTRSQTQLTPGERQGNVAGAFSAPYELRSRLRGAHLVLVDDVVTTGATLRAAASALFAAGARTISYMTFGRAPASGDRIFP